MRSLRSAPALFIAIFVFLMGPPAYGELPESHRKAIQKSADDYTKSTILAEQALAKAFDGTINQIRKNPKLQPAVKQALVDVVSKEKASFEKDGILPFSSVMRQSLTQYVATVEKSRLQVMAAYDKAIDYHQRIEKDDNAASSMTNEKNKVATPMVIARWHCVGTNYSADFAFVLRADGTTTDGRPWRFEGDKLVLRGERLVDTCVLDATGTTFKGKNQYGAAYDGTLAPPHK